MASETSSPTTDKCGPWNNELLREEFREAMRMEHNKHREFHGSPLLQLTDKLNEYAQEWANMSAEMEFTAHRPDQNNNIGECLQSKKWNDTTVGAIAAEVCEDFYKEIFLYDFSDGKYSNETAHFTQLVWYDTTELGVGIAIGESGRVYCVVNYTPQGNVSGGFQSNVLAIGTKYKPRPKLNDQSVFIPPTVTRLNCGENIDIFRQLLTNQHNIYRKHHGVPFLENVEYLNDVAQKWADHCAEYDELEHSETEYGENIFEYFSNDSSKYYPSAFDICKSFKEQGEDYTFAEETDYGALNFTQMVWKNSKEIGIGMQKAESGRVYVVCLYNPPGNIDGKFNKNVFRFNPLENGPVKLNIVL